MAAALWGRESVPGVWGTLYLVSTHICLTQCACHCHKRYLGMPTPRNSRKRTSEPPLLQEERPVSDVRSNFCYMRYLFKVIKSCPIQKSKEKQETKIGLEHQSKAVAKQSPRVSLLVASKNPNKTGGGLTLPASQPCICDPGSCPTVASTPYLLDKPSLSLPQIGIIKINLTTLHPHLLVCLLQGRSFTYT